MAVGLTTATATAILTGSRDVRAATPKKGGDLKVSLSQHGPTDTLDPALFTDSISYSRGRCHCNGLVQFNAAGMMLVVPQNCWHRFDSETGVKVMTATPRPTTHLHVDDPREVPNE